MSSHIDSPGRVGPNDTVVMGQLQIMKYDLGALTWADAQAACASLGSGWRLPTLDELVLMQTNKDKIGGFVNSLYWSSTEVPPANANIHSFVEPKTANDDKNYLFHVRAVRSVGTVTLNGLEVMTVDVGNVNFEDALALCAKLGDGWRLPTVDELNMLFINRTTIGGFVAGFYWGATEILPGSPCIQGFLNGKQSKDAKAYIFHVRPVRTPAIAAQP